MWIKQATREPPWLAGPAFWLLTMTESVSQAAVSAVRGGGRSVWVCGMIWGLW